MNKRIVSRYFQLALGLLTIFTMVIPAQGLAQSRSAPSAEVLTQHPLVAAADSPITIRYDFAAPRIARVGEYHSVTIEGLPKLEQPGLPRLPIKAARILIPFGRRVSGIEVICDTQVDLEGTYLIEPGQEPLPLSHEGPVTPALPSPEIYGS
jgi:hypothetical protein